MVDRVARFVLPELCVSATARFVLPELCVSSGPCFIEKVPMRPSDQCQYQDGYAEIEHLT